MWSAVAGFVSGRRTKWLVLALAALITGLLVGLGASPKVSNDPAAGLPASAESSRVAALREEFPSGRVTPAVIVYARASARLSARDLAAIDGRRPGLSRSRCPPARSPQCPGPGGRASDGAATPPRVSEDGRAATVVVPLDRAASSKELAAAVDRVRSAARAGLPAGLTAQVTGPAGVTADLAGVFDGADVTLLLTTVVVVALLLILTYRSPWLWLVPLAAVGVADQVTTALVAIVSRHTGLSVSNATTGIVEVLVFGAGTDYALLLIARYREELRTTSDRHEAMRSALLRAGRSIVASGGTVALSLASLVFATLPSDTGIGLASAVGVICALLSGLLLLPAALVTCGRWLFWPVVPRAPAHHTPETESRPTAPDRDGSGSEPPGNEAERREGGAEPERRVGGAGGVERHGGGAERGAGDSERHVVAAERTAGGVEARVSGAERHEGGAERDAGETEHGVADPERRTGRTEHGVGDLERPIGEPGRRVGVRERLAGGVWFRVGQVVARRPRSVVAVSLVLLAVLGAGLSGAHLGLSQADRFRTKAESIDGLATLSAHFPAGASDPVTVITAPAQAQTVLRTARTTPGVASAAVAETGVRRARIDVVLRAAPDTGASYAAVRALRDRLHAVPGAHALVGGTVATDLDTRDAAVRDQRVVIPIVLAIVLVILIWLLRALVGPVLLVLTVVASFAAALGGANFAFTHWLGYPALDTSVPLLAFLFLVALGVDYNIFLVSRAREEAVRQGTRAGVLTALTLTGGVITSAGVLLAAVFAVLGVLPLITLTELGVIVGFGVLLDTLLVRTLLVPALVTICGRRFWWPGGLSREDGAGRAGEAPPVRASPVR